MNYSKENKPRFKEIVNQVNLILLTSKNIQSFPFSILKVIQEKASIVCRTYTKAATYGVDISAFGTEDAIIQNLGERYIVFYNDDSNIVDGRKKFSLSHEFGHYKMDHNLNDKENYGLYEVEANFFAAQLLMPEQIINELRRRGMHITNENLQKWFGVSKLAAQKRIETLRKIDYSYRTDEEKSMDDYIVMKFQNFITEITLNPNFIDGYNSYGEEELQNERERWY